MKTLEELKAEFARISAHPENQDEELSKSPEMDADRRDELQREVESLKAEERALSVPAGATPLPVPPVEPEASPESSE